MKLDAAPLQNFEFAGFRLDSAARRVTRLDGTPVKLNSRAFDTLVVLLARPAQTLTKRFLLRQVWPDVVVGDNNLNQAVAAIRKALGDDAEPRCIIRTIPGRGFCCVADVLVTERRSAYLSLETAPREKIVTVADYL